jgi:hypothetical protein
MKLIRLALIFVIATIAASAQPREGKRTELSLSGSFQNYSGGGGSGSSSAFLISPRFGFFIVEGLEIEPELALMLSSGGDPAYVLNGNITYNFLSGGKSVPFLLAGYGLANTVPIFNVPWGQMGFKVDVLNLGLGLKSYLQEDIAIRLEYRYQNFSGHGRPTYDLAFGSFTQEVNARVHSLQFGFSLLI